MTRRTNLGLFLRRHEIGGKPRGLTKKETGKRWRKKRQRPMFQNMQQDILIYRS
jgi:hypothetical protein